MNPVPIQNVFVDPSLAWAQVSGFGGVYPLSQASRHANTTSIGSQEATQGEIQWRYWPVSRAHPSSTAITNAGGVSVVTGWKRGNYHLHWSSPQAEKKIPQHLDPRLQLSHAPTQQSIHFHNQVNDFHGQQEVENDQNLVQDSVKSPSSMEIPSVSTVNSSQALPILRSPSKNMGNRPGAPQIAMGESHFSPQDETSYPTDNMGDSALDGVAVEQNTIIHIGEDEKQHVSTSFIEFRGQLELIPTFLSCSPSHLAEYRDFLELWARIGDNLHQARSNGNQQAIHAFLKHELRWEQERAKLFDVYKPKGERNGEGNQNDQKVMDTLLRRWYRAIKKPDGPVKRLENEVTKLEDFCRTTNNQLASPQEYPSSVSASASYSSPSQHSSATCQSAIDYAALHTRYQPSPPCIQFNPVPGAPGNDSSIADLASILSRLSCAEGMRYTEPSSPWEVNLSLTNSSYRLYKINMGVEQAMREPENMGPRIGLGLNTRYGQRKHLDYEFLIAENVHKKEGYICHLYRITQVHFDFLASLRKSGMPYCQEAGLMENAPINMRQAARSLLRCTWLASIYRTALLPKCAIRGVVSVGSTFQPLVVQSGDYRPPLEFPTVGEALKVVDIMQREGISEQEYLLLQILCIYTPSDGDNNMMLLEAYNHYYNVLSRVANCEKRMEYLDDILRQMKRIGQLALQSVRSSLPLSLGLRLLIELFGDGGLAIEDIA